MPTPITSNPAKLNEEEIYQGAAHSQALLAKLGGNINHLLDLVLPIGSTITAYLTPTQFYDQGYDEDKWVLCDGQSVTSSQFHLITGNANVPDARSRYPRMKDHGAGVNPAGDLAMGATQDDAFYEHTHTMSAGGAHVHNNIKNGSTSIVWGDGGGSSDGKIDAGSSTLGGAVTVASAGSDHSHTMNNAGGNETRPDTTIVNVFIRIN